MVIFNSYVKLPEGRPLLLGETVKQCAMIRRALCFQFPQPVRDFGDVQG